VSLVPGAGVTTSSGLKHPMGNTLRSLVRRSIPRPAAARSAARDLQRGLAGGVAAEVRWAFAAPRAWLAGVTVNLVCSLAWLVVAPIHSEGHRDWVILVGTYFASFILADVTTTNVLGVDHVRVQKGLDDGVPLGRILLVKNLALLFIVGTPTVAAAVILTLVTETPGRLVTTVPEVAVPMISWLGVGNVISVLLPVGYEPLIRRWRQRKDLRRIALWLTHLALPYGVFYLADPFYGLPQMWFWGHAPEVLNFILGPDGDRSVVHIGAALVVWAIGSTAAVVLVRVRGLQIR
jgi:hypothetical protein